MLGFKGLNLPLQVKSKSCYCLTFDIEVGTDVFWVFLSNFMVPKKDGKPACDLYCKVHVYAAKESLLNAFIPLDRRKFWQKWPHPRYALKQDSA